MASVATPMHIQVHRCMAFFIFFVSILSDFYFEKKKMSVLVNIDGNGGSDSGISCVSVVGVEFIGLLVASKLLWL